MIKLCLFFRSRLMEIRKYHASMKRQSYASGQMWLVNRGMTRKDIRRKLSVQLIVPGGRA